MSISKEEFEELKARTSVIEATLAYTITNLSAKHSDIKPSIINALNADAKLNEVKNPPVAKALVELADLISRFSFTDQQ